MAKILEIEFTNRANTTLEISAGNSNVDIAGVVSKSIEVMVNQGIQGVAGATDPNATLDGGLIF